MATGPLTVQEVDDAIRDAMRGQRYRLRDGTEVEMAKLADLQKLRAEVEIRTAEEARGGAWMQTGFGGVH